MSHSSHYRSFRRRLYGSDDPTNSFTALKDDGYSTKSRANLTRLSSLKGKEKDVSDSSAHNIPKSATAKLHNSPINILMLNTLA